MLKFISRLDSIFSDLWCSDLVVSLERPINSSVSGPILFSVQMFVYRFLFENGFDGKIVNPLPVQLKSYMKKAGVEDISCKSGVVRACRQRTGLGRISSHEADAYFLALMAREVVLGTYKYKRPTDKVGIHSLEVIYGY